MDIVETRAALYQTFACCLSVPQPRGARTVPGHAMNTVARGSWRRCTMVLRTYPLNP